MAASTVVLHKIVRFAASFTKCMIARIEFSRSLALAVSDMQMSARVSMTPGCRAKTWRFSGNRALTRKTADTLLSALLSDATTSASNKAAWQSMWTVTELAILVKANEARAWTSKFSSLVATIARASSSPL